MIHYSFIVIDPLPSFTPPEFRRLLEFVRECGYEGVEVNLTEPPGIDLDGLERWLADFGLVIPSFMTGENYHQGLCLSSPDSRVRERSVQRLISCLDTAKRFSALLLIGQMQGQLSDEPDSIVANRRIVEGLRTVAEAAEERGVEMVLEPVNHMMTGFNNTVAEVLQVVTSVGSPALRPMVDTVHMNVEESSLIQPILYCGSTLRHVHLCESNGAIFGTGHVDFAAVTRALEGIGYDGFASVKVYRKAPWEVAARSSIEYLRSLAS